MELIGVLIGSILGYFLVMAIIDFTWDHPPLWKKKIRTKAMIKIILIIGFVIICGIASANNKCEEVFLKFSSLTNFEHKKSYIESLDSLNSKEQYIKFNRMFTLHDTPTAEKIRYHLEIIANSPNDKISIKTRLNLNKIVAKIDKSLSVHANIERLLRGKK